MKIKTHTQAQKTNTMNVHQNTLHRPRPIQLKSMRAIVQRSIQ